MGISTGHQVILFNKEKILSFNNEFGKARRSMEKTFRRCKTSRHLITVKKVISIGSRLLRQLDIAIIVDGHNRQWTIPDDPPFDRFTIRKGQKLIIKRKKKKITAVCFAN